MKVYRIKFRDSKGKIRSMWSWGNNKKEAIKLAKTGDMGMIRKIESIKESN